MNNRERELWVENDYDLYCMRKRSGLSISAFILKYRDVIDSKIRGVLK